jgi:hypothetical protein
LTQNLAKLMTEAMPVAPSLDAVTKEVLVDGKLVKKESVVINDQAFSFSRGALRVASLEEEWFEDVRDPELAIDGLRRCTPAPDLFTFWQRIPDVQPHYSYHHEWESLAVVPITTYEEWWNKRVKGTTRNMVRKSQKAGVELCEAEFDDAFVSGMVDIFNETPVRQGRPFWHYGKNFETVKRQFSRFLFRETLIGAYLKDELIGFVMLADAGRFGILGQFISKLQHRDKATNNALIAKTVEVCVQRRLPYLSYTDWRDTSLVDFKRYNGFQEMRVPRYFVPLTAKGRIALSLGLHRGWKAMLPAQVVAPLKKLRRSWNDYTQKSEPGA